MIRMSEPLESSEPTEGSKLVVCIFWALDKLSERGILGGGNYRITESGINLAEKALAEGFKIADKDIVAILLLNDVFKEEDIPAAVAAIRITLEGRLEEYIEKFESDTGIKVEPLEDQK